MSGLDTVVAIGLVFVCAVPIGLAGAWFTARGPSAMAGFFRPGTVADLGWPIGVQEEDAPTWNWDRAAPTVAGQAVGGPEVIELESGVERLGNQAGEPHDPAVGASFRGRL